MLELNPTLFPSDARLCAKIADELPVSQSESERRHENRAATGPDKWRVRASQPDHVYLSTLERGFLQPCLLVDHTDRTDP